MTTIRNKLIILFNSSKSLLAPSGYFFLKSKTDAFNITNKDGSLYLLGKEK